MPPIIIPDTGLPYYEMEAEFDAKVPYHITGWSDCIDLRQIPDIEKKVMAEFNRVRDLMINKQFEEWHQYLHEKEMELAVSMYKTTKDVEKNCRKMTMMS